jgi:hypothetical protein
LFPNIFLDRENRLYLAIVVPVKKAGGRIYHRLSIAHLSPFRHLTAILEAFSQDQ